MSGIKVCLTNNGKSEWLSLPMGCEEALAVLRTAGTEDGTYHISDCESCFGEKLDAMITRDDLSTVNYLAARLAELSAGHKELLEVMLEYLPNVIYGIERVIDFPDNIGAYEIYRAVHNSEDLALYYINDSGQIQMPEEWVEGIDLERFGRNLEKYEPGYYTKFGYLIATGLDWKPCFEENGNVPSDYRITINHA